MRADMRSLGSSLPRARCLSLAFCEPPVEIVACSVSILATRESICCALSWNSCDERSMELGRIEMRAAWWGGTWVATPRLARGTRRWQWCDRETGSAARYTARCRRRRAAWEGVGVGAMCASGTFQDALGRSSATSRCRSRKLVLLWSRRMLREDHWHSRMHRSPRQGGRKHRSQGGGAASECNLAV